MRNGATQFLKQTENWTKQNELYKKHQYKYKNRHKYDYKTFKTSNVM